MAKQKKDVVREIFERPQPAEGKVSTLFTHFRPAQKISPPKKSKLPGQLKPLPAAIDLGTSSVKLLQLAQGPKNELEVICIDREKYPSDKSIDLIARQREALKKLVGRNALAGPRAGTGKVGPSVVTTISVHDAQIYNLNFPQMSMPELYEAIRWKVTQLRPFDLDLIEIIYDFVKWDSPLGQKSSQQGVLLACVPRKVIENRISLLQEVGLNPVACELSSMSLVNLERLQPLNPAHNKITVWLDLGAEESVLAIARADDLYFCRTLSVTSGHLTRQIAQHGKMSEPEAEAAKIERGLRHWDKSTMVYNSLTSSLENLVVDIEQSFKYFSYHPGQSKITRFERVILAGGGGELKGLGQFLSQTMAVLVGKLNPFSLLKLSDRLREEKAELLNSAAEFSVCAGLAVGQKIAEDRRLEFISKPKRRTARGWLLKERLRQRPVQAACGILTVAILLILIQIVRAGFLGWEGQAAKSRIKAAQARLSRLQSSQLDLVDEQSKLFERKQELSARLQLLNQATRTPRDFSRVLAQVAGLLPEEVWVNKLAYAEKKLSATGSCADTAPVMQLVEGLKGSEQFTGATFKYIQKDPQTQIYNFEVVGHLK
ncbi:pilus assembly protein PilM [Candidatus Omnitrophota bacterium]